MARFKNITDMSTLRAAEFPMKIAWTDINLPFSEGIRELTPDLPDLENEEREFFDTTRKELWEKYSDQICEVRDHIRDDVLYSKVEEEGCPDADMEDRIGQLLSEWLKSNPDYQEAWDAQQVRDRILLWRENHPRMVAYRSAFDVAIKEEDSKTFKGRDLARPGVQIEMGDGKTYLLGDVNTLGGVCDDCVAFNPEDIVVRYRVLVNLNRETS